MAAPRNASIPEFYVYRLEVKALPFYVGIGRDRRASDRVRYVRYLMSREARGKRVRWNLSASVVARLLSAGYSVNVSYPRKNVVRAVALEYELREIRRLVAKGAVLANLHHNPARPKVADDVVRPLLRTLKRRGA
jgi:hypothetical protein